MLRAKAISGKERLEGQHKRLTQKIFGVNQGLPNKKIVRMTLRNKGPAFAGFFVYRKVIIKDFFDRNLSVIIEGFAFSIVMECDALWKSIIVYMSTNLLQTKNARLSM